MSIEFPKVVLGLQGTQMPANMLRGIGRWSTQYVLGLVTHRPEMIAAISIDRKLPLPPVVQLLPPQIPVVFSEEAPNSDSNRLVFHALSIFEDLELIRIWPQWAQDPAVGLVVTFYDMIPALYPEDYFQGTLRYLLESRYAMAMNADAVIAISDTTAKDVSRLLDIPDGKIFVTTGQISDRFGPYPAGRRAAYLLLPERLGIEPDFVLSIGNVDPRKNLDGLMRAYACLLTSLKERHQLVLTCSQGSSEDLARLQGKADELGIGDRVVLTIFVDDNTMTTLYQACHTMVYPSLYEGLGLPVIEAMCCGAATIVSDVGPLREIVHDPQARFDPYDVSDIGEKLRRILAESSFAEERRAEGLSDSVRYSWKSSDAQAVAAYDLAARRRR